MPTDLRTDITNALHAFTGGDLTANCSHLLDVLGYRSEKRYPLEPNTAQNFVATFATARPFNAEHALTDAWTEANVLFQLTDREVAQREQMDLALDDGGWNRGLYRSFLFLAVGLSGERYSRSALATITRAVNRLFDMPTPIFFRYGDKLTLAIILHRPGKRAASKDVLEKVTLIKDIDLRRPHAAHVRILEELALSSLRNAQSVGDFDELQSAWAKTLDISELNKRFYQELANWYYWAVETVTFPRGDSQEDEETRNAVAVIRLITRLIFVWFIKEKGLVPDALFDRQRVSQLLHDMGDDSDGYYKAILQNLFFATLNTEMNTPAQPRNRIFRSAAESGGYNRHYGVHNVYRYADLFRLDEAGALALFAEIPFLNGGLFECLDKEIVREGKRKMIPVDGFSERDDNPLHAPNVLFFGKEQSFDLNEVFGTHNKPYKVRGLFDIFHRYKFTVEENTPIDEEVALDPELLGKVFENLLAAYNPETRTTARKQTGSFYTPREIVDYMVDEALIAYLGQQVTEQVTVTSKSDSHLKPRLRRLFAYTDEAHDFASAEVDVLIDAIDHAKILDPACGSGAFPMGILHKLVFILRKLDPNNTRWKQQQLARAQRDRELTEQMEDEKNRQHALEDIEARIRDIEYSFTEQDHELDYTRKLYLIENCIYGVDIQPIAVQIAKLRFFISLVADQRVDDAAPNRNVRALPNLETKFVAANSLLGIVRPAEKPKLAPALAPSATVKHKVDELADVFAQYLKVTGAALKEKWLSIGREVCAELNALLVHDATFTPLNADWLFPTTPDTSALRALLPGDGAMTASHTTIEMRNPEIERTEAELRRVRQRHFTAKTTQTKKKYRDADARLRERLGDLLERDGWEHATTEMLAKWDPYNQHTHAEFFDPEWMFGVIDGFDVVIGNPPYVRADAGEAHVAFRKRIEASGQYETLWEKWDLYIPFIELGYKLLRHGGVTTMIVSDAYCHAKYAQKSQTWFLQHSRVLRLDFFSKIQIFDAAVRNVIYFFQKADGSNNRPERRLHEPKFGLITELSTDYQSRLDYRLFFPDTDNNAEFSKRILLLQKICYVSYGLRPNSDENAIDGKFVTSDVVSSTRTELHSKPYVEGKHLANWLPKEHIWLEWNTERASGRFCRPTFPEMYPVPEKLLAQRSPGPDPVVCYDSVGFIFTPASVGFIPWLSLAGVRNRSLQKSARYRDEKPRADLPKREQLEQTSKRFAVKYLLAVMNSSAARDYLRAHRRSNIHLYPDDWKALPIPDVSLEEQQPLVKLVDEILALKTQNPAADVSALEAEIDQLVYRLYGLTEEEVKMVEGKA